jgi:hypothetical protein
MFTRKQTRAIALAAMILAPLAMLGCSSNPVSPGKDLQVANVADNFQFQVTALQRYTATYQYTWTNTGTAASVNQASSLTGGTAVLVVKDNAGTQVYSRSQTENGTFDTTAGVAGSWTITLITNKASGTINFRVQKKP